MYVNFKLYGLLSSVTSWHTTTYTASAAIMFCYCLGEYFQRERERRKALKWFALFALGPLILGTSAASNVAALLGVLLVALLYRNKMLIIISVAILFIFVPLSLLFSFEYSLFSSIIFPGKTEEQIYTLHGRTYLWGLLLEYFKDSPLIGHGFAILSTPRGLLFANNPHNSLFSVLLGTGVFGMLTVFIFGSRLLREFYQGTAHGRPGAIGCTAAICAGLVNSLSQPLVLDEWQGSSLVFVSMMAFFLLFVILPFRQERLIKKTPSSKMLATRYRA